MRVCPRCRSIYSMPVDRCGIDGSAIVEQDTDPLVGTSVDRYEIVEPLGRGAMGCVYRARHSVLGSDCALKVLYGNFALNQRLTERFRREAQAIGKMSHPNVVDVVDFGRTAEGLTFLVMELVEGRTLEEIILRDGPLPPARAARIARQLASGLGEAHRRGFVHRDMKPANVMVTQTDELEVVKILDFGVVGLIQAAASAKLTAVGHIVGTPTYMAPEQARTSSVGPAADLYALGVILFEMSSGRPPFEGTGVAEVLLRHLNDPPPMLRPSGGLERLVAQLLEKDPEKRLASAARLIQELDKLELGAPKTEQILLQNVLDRVSRLPELEAVDGETVELETSERRDTDDLDRATQLDLPSLRGVRPSIPPGTPRLSTSSVDTTPPERSLEAPSIPITTPVVVASPDARTIKDTPGGVLASKSAFAPTAMPVLTATVISSLRRELHAPDAPSSADDAPALPASSKTLLLTDAPI
ncbi:protein kinase, partial [Myxococcota bacterium]|nr:protein kinase [Myxococcota bacterium]